MTYGIGFIARRRPGGDLPSNTEMRALVRGLHSEGWALSPEAMAGGEDSAVVYDASPFGTVDCFGLFEAPDPAHAMRGLRRLDESWWASLFDTQWLIGPRDLAPVAPEAPRVNQYGFLALWLWNDAWHRATTAQRDEYDAECDIAFRADSGMGVLQIGRFDTSAFSGWDQLALWEVESPETLRRCMVGHEQVADFKFTTSTHCLGRRRLLAGIGRS
jgi:hypothetical protein